MGRRDELSEQIKALQGELDGLDDDEYEVWTKDDKGRDFRVGGKHAKSLLQRLGVIESDEPETDAEEVTEDDPEPPKGGYFGKSKK